MTCAPLGAPLASGGVSSIADALRSVDCMAGQATASAFAHIFGSEGVLTTSLTIALTLYVALFAIGLLTGRVTLGLSTLTPRMMALGLALTFATSWIAYSQVVWTLLSTGPDWIASSVLGIKGSASQVFAQRLDTLFQTVADAAQQSQPATEEAKRATTTPAQLLSYAALLLLLGTVGVLVTSRIALAAILTVGPIFLIFSLFSATRGLFEGWVKAAVMFALVPLFTVMLGVGSVAMLTPVVSELNGGAVDMTQAATVFVAACIHCALMAMVLKMTSALTSGWRLPIGVAPATAPAQTSYAAPATVPYAAPAPPTIVPMIQSRPIERDERLRSVIAAVNAPHQDIMPETSARILTMPGVSPMMFPSSGVIPATSPRARDIGRGMSAPASASSLKDTLA